MKKNEPIILSLGGSLIVPNGGIDIGFLKKFNKFIRKKIANGWRFFIVCGGGLTARQYQNAAQAVKGDLLKDDMDWIGIHATRLNAHMIRSIFRDLAHVRVIKDPSDVEIATEPVVVAAGWKPGWSTDYIGAILAKEYKIRTLINMSNVTMVYDKDPRKFPNAKPIKNMSWEHFRMMVGNKWEPGLNVPFDPIASKLASEIDLEVIILKGNDFANLEKVFAGEKFVGTTITS